MSTKRMAGYTHEYLPLVSDYSQVQAHNKIHSRVFTTCQLLCASTMVHDRSYSQVFSTHQ